MVKIKESIKEIIKNKLKELLNKVIACGLLGAWAGAEGTSKAFRRFGIPLLLLAFAGFHLKDMRVFWVFLMSVPFSIGYGQPGNDDEGSVLGRFCWKLSMRLYYKIVKEPPQIPVKMVSLWSNVLTRGTIGVLVCLSLLPIPIINGKWLIYMISSLIIVGVYATLSWRDLGMFEWRGKKLLKSEAILYGTILILFKWMV